MGGLFYSVDLARDERMAGNPRLVEKFLVELCQEHCLQTIGRKLTVNL